MSQPERTAHRSSQNIERRLAAILSADVKGYSRLMGEDEEATLRTLTSHRTLIDSLIAQHRGRIVGTAGDSVLAEFASMVAAVQCAVVIQQTLQAANARLPAERRMEFRIGINLGDVIVEGDDIYGEGVNVAARLQAIAPVGGIAVSATVRDQAAGKVPCAFEDRGENIVKGLQRPVHGYVPGEILEIDAPVERRHRIAPDLPWRLGRRQPTNEPRLLGRAKHRLWRCVLSWVSELRARERNGRRWIASVHRAAGIENLRDLLGNDGRELPRLKGSRVWFLAQWLGAKAPVVSKYELDIPPPLHCPVSR